MKIKDKSNSILKLDPNFVTGLTDAEGCFSVIASKNDKAEFKVYFNLRFKITMLENEFELLKLVESFFGCGVLRRNLCGTVDFVIKDFSSIKNKVIPHFLKYPLRGTKYLDFISFKEAFNIFDSKIHLTKEGVNKLYKIKEGMNIGRKYSNSTYYSPSHTMENNVNFIPINGHYVSGFIAGDGCLFLDLTNRNFCRMVLQIAQHIKNKLLVISIANYFQSPSKVYSLSYNSIQVTLCGVKLWEKILFRHFLDYPLYGNNKLKLDKLFIIKELLLDNKHLVQTGKFRQWKPEYKLHIIDIWNS